MTTENCVLCGEPLTEEQMEYEEEFCSRSCAHEAFCSDAEDRHNESARYGEDTPDLSSHPMYDVFFYGPSNY